MQGHPRSFAISIALIAAGLGGCAHPVDTPSEPASGSLSQALTTEQCLAYQAGGTVTICHATGARGNAFVKVKVATDGCVHGHAQHAHDFVLVGGDCGGPTCLPVG